MRTEDAIAAVKQIKECSPQQLLPLLNSSFLCNPTRARIYLFYTIRTQPNLAGPYL